MKSIKNEVHKTNREGILLIDKPAGVTSFSLIRRLRYLSKIKKIGHAGTLDPFATGVMVYLVGKNYTKKSNDFLQADKEYTCCLHLGIETDSYDIDGEVTQKSDIEPSLEQIQDVINQHFQGAISQVPPMFSAKKVKGQKLYDLARKGISIEREAQQVFVETTLLAYNYPYLELSITCSKGCYIRSIASDMGKLLGSGAHLKSLRRTRSGSFKIENCLDGEALKNDDLDIFSYLITL
ncbi:MAG: tRNA pseudouridine(55) synthase TruB [Chlamydiales bacterium]|nr:tRNA pseudouridine(55) synthase TruB [Chlamydiales bacterium]NCF70493.1 tRNA pseudouridine(55) synthase TruB [Chlamydiales bacterium]